MKLVKEGREDRECRLYKTVLQEINTYLSENYLAKLKLLPIPEYIRVAPATTSGIEENQTPEHESGKHLFMLENKAYLGFKRDLMPNKDGLDYEHSVIVIAALAKFHATSYCFRRQNHIDMVKKYPVLRDGLAISIVSEDTMETLDKVFRERRPQFDTFSKLFFLHKNKDCQQLVSDLDRFGVLSHGQFCRENLLFKYKSNQDAILSCSDVVFQDLSNCHFGSCVIDLLQFVLTSVDAPIRRSFMADFVCSVYYDNFAKTVSSINSKIDMFSKKEFIKEFNNLIVYGFYFAAEIHTKLFKDALEGLKDEACKDEIQLQYENNIILLLEDVVQFIKSAKVTVS